MATVCRAFRGRLLTPTQDSAAVYHRDGLLVVDEAGRLSYAGAYRKSRAPTVVQDLRPGVMLPGFVDCHVHYPQTRIIGRATGPLLTWLEESVFPEEQRFSRRPYATAVADEMIDRMLAAGTTCAGIYSSSSPQATEVLLSRLAERGLRGAVGLTLMDVRVPKPLMLGREAAMKACRRLVRRWHGHDDGRLEVAVTPRFALSCSRAMLRDAGRLASEHGLLVQTHIGETHQELAATRSAHRYAQDYLDVYDQAGLLGERTVLAHAIHLSEREWDRVREAGASIAHCPDSNFFLGSGRMPLHQAQRRGIVVGLGSDVAAGRSFSLRRAMASAYDNAKCIERSVALSELLRMATLGGATVLGMADRIGSLEVGKEADFVLLGLSERSKTLDEVLAELVFDSDDLGVAACYLRGRKLA